MPPRRHHPFGPSRMPALSHCPQYEGKEYSAGPAAERGTRIGASVEAHLTGQHIPEAYTAEELRYKEKDAALEIEWIMETLQELYPEAFDISKYRKPGDGLEIEREVTLRDADFQEVNFGTLDYYRAGHLSDLKTGEKRNYRAQFANLALALMDRDGLDAITCSILWSKFQEVETWNWTRADAEAVFWPIWKAIGGEARISTYCSWCRKGDTCATRLESVSLLPLNVKPGTTLAEYAATMSPDERGAFMRHLEVARKWAAKAEETLEAWFLEDPELRPFTGYMVGTTNPRRIWKDEPAALRTLKEKAVEMGKNPMELVDISLVTQTEIHKLLGKGNEIKALLDSLLVKPAGERCMVEED